MRRNTRLATTVFVALATFALSGCGADDSASASSSPSVANNDAAQSSVVNPATGVPNASALLAADPAAASDAITQSMQASLAADSQQVAPVMHYAPGDNTNSN
ncbi:hypothetical protein GNZ12_23885 [Paraburkholderia sp. 1N]|uniref:Lipoprotein n=1 Tax=Paraburkholderia solitsugae TaxID=2675748 RepID=A0ABX2BUJ7_9BURK|nr:hypothetical protein [Paraburkholderia solitsugae]NPT44294.1 hypothetical protein [Paraburkholderia solitsugae]